MIDELKISLECKVRGLMCTSQEGVMVVSASHRHSGIRGRRSGHVERFWEVVIFPSSFSPEETLISDFIDHFWIKDELISLD